jgi:hypothetical protein
MKKTNIGSFIFFYSGLLMAGPPIDGKVTYAGTNSNNVVFLGLDKLVEEPGCPGEQVALPPDSAIKEKILSVALTAKTTGATVQIKTNGCYLGKPSMLPDANNWAWLYIK